MKSIRGVHAILFSRKADSVRDFFKTALGLRSIDAGGGWLIFALPPAELAVHPDKLSSTTLYLMSDNVRATVKELRAKGIRFRGAIIDEGWGLLTYAKLPDGQLLGIYEPRHPSPLRLKRSRGRRS